MDITYLDLLLKQLYLNRKNFEGSLFEDIGKEFSVIKADITGKEMLILLYKLIDDGYVTKKKFNRTTTNTITGEVNDIKPLYGAYISFKGILFYEDVPTSYLERPYEHERELKRRKEREAIRENWPKRNWVWVAIASFFFGSIVAPLTSKYLERLLLPDGINNQLSPEKIDSSRLPYP